jgi:hypothetical protein
MWMVIPGVVRFRAEWVQDGELELGEQQVPDGEPGLVRVAKLPVDAECFVAASLRLSGSPFEAGRFVLGARTSLAEYLEQAYWLSQAFLAWWLVRAVRLDWSVRCSLAVIRVVQSPPQARVWRELQRDATQPGLPLVAAPQHARAFHGLRTRSWHDPAGPLARVGSAQRLPGCAARLRMPAPAQLAAPQRHSDRH